jgi:Zn-dependent metalloprotease
MGAALPLIAQKNDYLELQWRVVYLRDGNLWEVRLNPNLEIRSSQRVGSQFHETAAWVFPQGPKKSTLQEVSLKDLLLKPTLSNSRVFVSSQADLKVSDVEEPLKFALDDSRFDQVQVFYFLNESLNWFEKNLNFKLPMQLQAEVHMGAPEKTNSAFYYQGKIRLGQGDDEFYSRIPHDPSIVIHESVHALVEVLARLPYEGEGGSLNEAFADFFTALQIGSPHMGEAAYLKAPFRRTILNDLTLKDKNGGLYHDSGIASGTLWELGTKLGLVKGQKLALLTLNRLTPASGFSDFGKTLRSVILENTSGAEQDMALAILDKRGFAP